MTLFIAGHLPVLLVIFLLFTTGSGQTAAELTVAQTAERLARKAYQDKAYPEFLTQMLTANGARPNHPRLIYNLAAAYTLNGQNDAAVNAIERLAKMGLYFAVEKDDNFKTFLQTDRFKSIQTAFAKNLEPVNGSSKAFTIENKELIVESIAHYPKNQTFYLGSVHQRKIVAVDKNGNASDLSRESDGLWSVLGMRVDAARGWLWVCTTAFPQMKGFQPADKGRAGIFKYELRTGKLAAKYILPPGEDHALGDLIIGGDGTVYATDSVSPVIYRIKPKSSTIEEFLRSDRFASLQGLAFDERDKNLYTADYSKGIFRVNMADKQIVQQQPSEFITLLGIDGLYFHRGKLIAIQNGVTPNRVLSLSVNSERITDQRILEANQADFNEPTLGVLTGDDFYFNANSQWAHVNEKAELAIDKLRPPVILKLNLNIVLNK